MRREGCGSRRTLPHSTRTRLSAGLRVSHGWASVRTSDKLGRYLSARRTGCANERPSGSVRGGTGQLVALPRSPIELAIFLVKRLPHREAEKVTANYPAQKAKYDGSCDLCFRQLVGPRAENEHDGREDYKHRQVRHTYLFLPFALFEAKPVAVLRSCRL